MVNSVSFWGTFLSSVLLLPFTCLGMLILSFLYCFLAGVALVIKVFSSKPRQSGTTSNTANPAEGGNNARDIDRGNSGNAASNADFIRELERIFEIMEEGTGTSASNSDGTPVSN